jgi:hypothetical protein
MRVTFLEENGSSVSLTKKVETAMQRRIMACLTDGVMVCGRKYRLLTYSPNQLKERSCWMWADDENGLWTVERVRQWMGDFSSISSVPKCAARMSQAFSR